MRPNTAKRVPAEKPNMVFSNENTEVFKTGGSVRHLESDPVQMQAEQPNNLRKAKEK